MVYGEGRDPIPKVSEPTVIFFINNTYRPDSTEEQIYQSTRKGWRIGNHSRDRAVYALGVAHGVVRGAYRIDRWVFLPDDNGRWGFEGEPAQELGHLVGTSTLRIKAPQGVAGGFRLFLDGIPPE